MVLFPALACLHIDRSFVRLNVRSANQLAPHGGDHWDQQLANFQDPAVQRCAADFQSEVPFQNHALAMQGRVIAILADDRVDDNPVTRQALLDDPWWQRCGNHSEFLTRPASPFLSFRDQHEVLRWLHIQLGTLLVADHHWLIAAFHNTLTSGPGYSWGAPPNAQPEKPITESDHHLVGCPDSATPGKRPAGAGCAIIAHKTFTALP